MSTGFDRSIAKKLLREICFKPSEFTLSERFQKEAGWLTCTICFEKEEESYVCKHYDASFLKAIEVPDLVIQSVNIRELDQEMEGIRWEMDEKRDINFDSVNQPGWDAELKIETAISELLKLTVSIDGNYFADYLKLKHWSGIQQLAAQNNLNAIRSKFEVSQRFYFFDGKGISIEEAYRFLLNRWLEKKMNARTKKRDEANPGEGAAGTKGNSLLHRKRKTQKVKR